MNDTVHHVARACATLRRHSISLYANISHIRWDTTASNVTGCVMPPEGGPMKAFDIDAKRATDFQVANRLWDLIGAATATA